MPATARRSRISGRRAGCWGENEALSPRHAFIHAVAGQPARGYERMVLEHGEAPASFTHSVSRMESARAGRRAQLDAAGSAEALQNAVPRLAPGVALRRRPVLGAGEFVWGHVLITDGYPEGTPCSPLVAQVVSRVDGRTPVGEMVSGLCAGLDPSQRHSVVGAALQTLRILHVDGTVTGLFAPDA